MSWWTSCGSSSPQTETLRARLAVTFGSGQANEDRKLLEELSLKPQKKSQQMDMSHDEVRFILSPADEGVHCSNPLQEAVRVT